jgi:predicted O-methyltransferase YrrM
MGYIKKMLAASQPGSSSGRRLLRPGALIVADNVLQNGKAAAAADDSAPSKSVEAVREYNDFCTAEPRLQTVLLPLWDGLSVARVVD